MGEREREREIVTDGEIETTRGTLNERPGMWRGDGKKKREGRRKGEDKKAEPRTEGEIEKHRDMSQTSV